MDLDQIQEHIRNNLNSVESDYLTNERSLLANRQDELNKIALIFATVVVVGVIATLAELHPLKEVFDPTKHTRILLDYSLFNTEVIMTVLTAIGFILCSISRVEITWHYSEDSEDEMEDEILRKEG